MANNKIDALIANPNAVRAVVPIVYYGKSGSYLLSSLFDGHGEVLSVPFGALHHFVPKLHEFVTLSKGRVTPESYFTFLRANCPDMFRDTLDTRSLDTDPDCGFGCPPEKFAAVLETAMTNLGARGGLDMGGLFNALHVAYAAAIGQVISTETPIIVWQQHYWMTPTYRDFVRNMLTDVRYIVCTRLPEVGLNSHWAAGIREEQDLPFHHIPAHYLAMMQHGAIIDPESEDGKCVAIRFEDMHANTEPLMRKLADWVGISWDPCLMDSTIDGRTWWYVKGPKRYTGANPKTARAFRTEWMSAVDKHNIRYALADRYALWGYDKAPYPGRASRLIPRWITEKILFRVPPRIQWWFLFHEIKVAWRHFRNENKAYRAALDTCTANHAPDSNTRYTPLIRPDD